MKTCIYVPFNCFDCYWFYDYDIELTGNSCEFLTVCSLFKSFVFCNYYCTLHVQNNIITYLMTFEGM